MRAAMLIVVILLAGIIPATGTAQNPYKPEVEIDCEVLQDINYNSWDSNGYLYCDVRNDNPHPVSVEFTWHFDGEVFGPTDETINANSEAEYYIELYVESTREAGEEPVGVEVVVTDSSGVPCEDCPVDEWDGIVEVATWSRFQISVIDEQPGNVFETSAFDDPESCPENGEISASFLVEMYGNSANTTKVAYQTIVFNEDEDEIDSSLGEITEPPAITFEMEPGTSKNVSASFKITPAENRKYETWYVILVFAGSVKAVDEIVAEGYTREEYDYERGYCTVSANTDSGSDGEALPPIIIQAQSDDKLVSIIAGAAGATTFVLLIILGVMLLRKKK